MSDDSGGGGWFKWLVGILVTLAVGVAVPVYLANRPSDREPTTPVDNGNNVIMPTLDRDLFAPAHLFANKTSGPTGSQVLLSGDGFQANEEVKLSMQTFELARTRADSAGKFANVAVTVPTQLKPFAPQQFEFNALGTTSIKHATFAFTVSG